MMHTHTREQAGRLSSIVVVDENFRENSRMSKNLNENTPQILISGTDIIET
jgi:hypothetical protein